MVGEIKQKHRKRSPVGKSDYTLLGWFSCWESACIFPHCIWRSLIVLCCFLQQNWKEYDEISQSPESSFVQQIQPWPFLIFSFPSFPHFCWLVFSWMLPLKPPYQYSEMISEVWIKSIKSSRDQSARHICRVWTAVRDCRIKVFGSPLLLLQWERYHYEFFILPSTFECGSSSCVKLRLGPALQVLALQFFSRSWEQPAGTISIFCQCLDLVLVLVQMLVENRPCRQLKVLCFLLSLFPMWKAELKLLSVWNIESLDMESAWAQPMSTEKLSEVWKGKTLNSGIRNLLCLFSK